MSVEMAIRDEMDRRLLALEQHFEADVVSYNGPITLDQCPRFRDLLEQLATDEEPDRERLVVILCSPGGSAEAVENMAEVTRHHYQEVFFVVPEFAFSAGTIFCMSGNRIYMDYASSLGPIDPQIHNGKEWVPALGYLDKVEEMLQKSRDNTISQAEFLILQSQDLAMLRVCEQARDLTVTLLKKWLVEFKFKDWDVHETNQAKLNQPVTDAEKEARAEEIATVLGDNKRWLSHGRMIGAKTLHNELRLKIDDYSDDEPLRNKIRRYNKLWMAFVGKASTGVFLHSRNYF